MFHNFIVHFKKHHIKTESLAIMAKTYSLVSKTNIVGGWGKANEGICEEIECNLT